MFTQQEEDGRGFDVPRPSADYATWYSYCGSNWISVALIA